MKPTGFTAEQVDAILLRDGGICCMCGAPAQTANHRENRGQGGWLAGNRLANGCAICSACNGAIEDGPLAEQARFLGIKLRRGDDPEKIHMWSRFFRLWVILTDTALHPTEHADIHIRPEPLP